MKKIIIILGLLLLSFNAAAELKAAFVNSAIILSKAPQAIAAQKTLKKEFSQREQDIKKLALEAQQQEKQYQKDAAIMSAEQKKSIEDEVIQKKRKLRFDAQSLKEDVDHRRKQEIEKLRIKIGGVIKQYATSNGYDFIFTEGVAFASDAVNITDDILKELSK